MSLWFTENYDDRIRLGLKVKKSLYHARSQYQMVDVFETEHFGKALALDGIFMTSVGDEFFYHEMLVHPLMTTAKDVGQVLIIGGGDGGTAREILRHPEVEKVTMVEIDGDVVTACKKYLPEIGTEWDNPRFELRIEDGVKFVNEAAENSFDAVFLDGSDPVGPAEGLFGTAFYKAVRRVLKPEGLFALQSESPTVFPKVYYDVQFALRDVFGTTCPYFGTVPLYGAGMWTWTLCGTAADPKAVDEARMTRIEAGCRYYNRDIHHGAFAVPNFVRRKLEG